LSSGSAKAEDFVQLADNGLGFRFVEFAIEILTGGERNAGLGAGVAVFLEDYGFSAGAGKGVNQANEPGGIAAKPEIEPVAGPAFFGLFTISWTGSLAFGS
jgi:hypothetical protein